MDKILIGRRIEQLREAFGLNKQELANMAGTSDVTIGFWESGRHTPTGNKLVRLANALGTTAEYLIDGTYKPKKINEELEIQESGTAYKANGKVPLISWVQAGEWTETHDLYNPGDAEEWLPCPTRHSPDTYALRVKGDSMESPTRGDRSYHPGTIIFVDPRKRAEVGNRVIARLPNTTEATFKVFSCDAGTYYLRPLNPQYPTIELPEGAVICGVVIGSFYPEN